MGCKVHTNAEITQFLVSSYGEMLWVHQHKLDISDNKKIQLTRYFLILLQRIQESENADHRQHVNPAKWSITSVGAYYIITNVGAYYVITNVGAYYVITNVGAYYVITSVGAYYIITNVGAYYIITNVDAYYIITNIGAYYAITS